MTDEVTWLSSERLVLFCFTPWNSSNSTVLEFCCGMLGIIGAMGLLKSTGLGDFFLTLYGKFLRPHFHLRFSCSNSDHKIFFSFYLFVWLKTAPIVSIFSFHFLHLSFENVETVNKFKSVFGKSVPPLKTQNFSYFIVRPLIVMDP